MSLVTFLEVVETVGKAIDIAGVVIIVAGVVVASVVAVNRVRLREPKVYSSYRQQLGRSILLGLELLVAADIIRTIAVEPSLRGVAVLGGIVLIRTFLSFALELEITGRWPWQKAPPAVSADDAGGVRPGGIDGETAAEPKRRPHPLPVA